MKFKILMIAFIVGLMGFVSAAGCWDSVSGPWDGFSILIGLVLLFIIFRVIKG